MTKETRTDIQVFTAVAMLVAGVGLSIAGFVVPSRDSLCPLRAKYPTRC